MACLFSFQVWVSDSLELFLLDMLGLIKIIFPLFLSLTM